MRGRRGWPNLRRCEAFNLEPPCLFAMADRPPNAVADEEEESSDEEASTTTEIKSKRCQIGREYGREYGECTERVRSLHNARA